VLSGHSTPACIRGATVGYDDGSGCIRPVSEVGARAAWRYLWQGHRAEWWENRS